LNIHETFEDTIGKNNDSVKVSYLLWLSLIWIVDVIFDKFQSKIKSGDSDRIINIFHQLNNGEMVDVDCECTPENLIDCLPQTITVIYGEYLKIIKKYRTFNAIAFNNLIYCLNKYFDTMLSSKVSNMSVYKRWTLDSGAMMCIL